MKNIKHFREKSIISALIFLFIVIVGAHKYVSYYYHEDKCYEWHANAQTTIGLPVMFAKCSLHHTGHYEKNCDKNTMLYGDNDDRAISCGGSGIGDGKDLYPDNLKILYYSFNENKFYGGTFKLDYNKILSIAEKMRKAVQIEYDLSQNIVFETTVYPKGKVEVSMKSYIKTSVGKAIIGSFQAKPENHDWSVFADSDYANKRSVSKNTSIAVQRALLLNKYNWKVDIILPAECTIKKLDVDVYGNKYLEMDTLKNSKLPSYGNFVYLPQQLYLNWKRKDTIEFSTELNFDEKEIIKAFETIHTKNDTVPITMKLIVKDDTTAVRAILYNKGKNIELKNIKPSGIWKQKIYHY
ncbi:DUF2931 family protein [Flavobacterium quisquiliarum]|uniref:DUF2931 family protein n=1 Tax=Flavobacterium quisquiliarum TaxID=1834436 RepID=A0ABV8W9W6_9FLAO|nr:DUF2931 family protein [Flavobacterium quisquiliarum]MBW1657946.1 DUF2931 family protein [Flavobacterium quisquiliarum]NWL01003.1 hypothetical protein [Flavobacterium collinsii]